MTLADKWYGDATITYKDFAAGTVVYGRIIPGSLSINLESPEDRAEFEDGSAADQEIGRRLVIEVDISDMVPATVDTLETYQGDVDILFHKPNKTVTFQGSATQPNYNIISIVDGKFHIKTTCNWPVNTDIATLMAIA